jgi:hypothetical protein
LLFCAGSRIADFGGTIISLVPEEEKIYVFSEEKMVGAEEGRGRNVQSGGEGD